MSSRYLIRVNYCLTPSNRISNAVIEIDDGRILAFGGASAFPQTQGQTVIERLDCYAMPGFIDTHIYGSGGFDCMQADSDTHIEKMSSILVEHGVTSFVPTTQSADRQHQLDVIVNLSSLCHAEMPGAVPVGIHIEGPFISPERRGAHPKRFVRAIDLDETRQMFEKANGDIKIFTFAPELEGSDKLIALVLEHGAIPAMGHTTADQESVERAVEAGARRCSHLLNGMESLKQREVGLAAISMIDERVWVELIVDGVHIHPSMIDLACRCIDNGMLVCISNSNEAAGLADGVYKLGEETIHVHGGRSTREDGTIAGSVNFLDQNYRHLLEFTHLANGDAAACFTSNPARSIGLTDRGEIRPGKRADIVILDQEHTVQMTIVGGKVVYDKQALDQS